MKTLDVCGIV
jgi:replication factor A1